MCSPHQFASMSVPQFNAFFCAEQTGNAEAEFRAAGLEFGAADSVLPKDWKPPGWKPAEGG